MAQKVCTKQNCLWSDCGRFCEALSRASVPLDDKWPNLILYLRGLKDNTFLSEVQKAALQELLLTVFESRDFSDAMHAKISNAIHVALIAPYQEKLVEIMREANSLTEEANQILGTRKQQVMSVTETMDEDLQRGVEPADVLSGLRDVLKDVVTKMEQDSNALRALSYKDSLTGLANRRSLEAFLDETIVLWQKNKVPAALIMMDIDHFKKFNDTYGHLVGDQVLRTLAGQLKKFACSLESKPEDKCLAARYGGEEFVLILRGSITENISEIANSLRINIAQTALRLLDSAGNVLENGVRVTVSLGASPLWKGWTSALQTNLLDCADKALYLAKAKGRNCSVLFSPEHETEQYRLIKANNK